METSSSRLFGACSSSLKRSCSQRPSSFHSFLFLPLGLRGGDKERRPGEEETSCYLITIKER